MATRPVRFEFYCDNAPDGLKFLHDISEDLITTRAQAQQDVHYQNRFRSALLPIIKEHEKACLEASNPSCGICGLPVATALQTPTSWLHQEGDPFVGVFVSGICGEAECELQTRRDVQKEMAGFGAAGLACVEVTACRICGKIDGTMRCGQCKTVAYCGKEHQKQDWRVHKRMCAPAGPRLGAMK